MITRIVHLKPNGDGHCDGEITRYVLLVPGHYLVRKRKPTTEALTCINADSRKSVWKKVIKCACIPIVAPGKEGIDILVEDAAILQNLNEVADTGPEVDVRNGGTCAVAKAVDPTGFHPVLTVDSDIGHEDELSVSTDVRSCETIATRNIYNVDDW